LGETEGEKEMNLITLLKWTGTVNMIVSVCSSVVAVTMAILAIKLFKRLEEEEKDG
jgi:hypothetical protein